MFPEQNASRRYTQIFERFKISPDHLHFLILKDNFLEAACDDYLLALSTLRDLKQDRREDDPVVLDYTELVRQLEREIAGMLGCSPQ